MAKLKLSEFKKYLAELDKAQLHEELIKLFSKFDQVKDFYGQELLDEEGRKKMLEDTKVKTYHELWTRGGNPKDQNIKNTKNIIRTFEKIAVFPSDLIDLLLHHVHTTSEQAHMFGGAKDATYNLAIASFEKAIKLIKENFLEEDFKEICKAIITFDNLDPSYLENLVILYEELEEDK